MFRSTLIAGALAVTQWFRLKRRLESRSAPTAATSFSEGLQLVTRSADAQRNVLGHQRHARRPIGRLLVSRSMQDQRGVRNRIHLRARQLSALDDEACVPHGRHRRA